jgi:hypothetical protein
MNLKEIGINTRDWVDSSQDRDYWRALVNAALNLRVTSAMEFVNIAYELKQIFSLNLTDFTVWNGISF